MADEYNDILKWLEPYRLAREAREAKAREESAAAELRKREKDKQTAEAYAKYLTNSAAIEKELPKHIAYNPAATNWMFSLSGKRMTDEPYMSGLTNIPNTLIAAGHGAPSGIPGVGSGLYPDQSLTNKLTELVRDQKAMIDDNFMGLISKVKSTSGGVSIEEIAKGIGSQTNEVKRVILLSCFAAGYKPEDIRKHFPNADEIISSTPNDKFASIDSFYDLFRKEKSKAAPSEIAPYVSPFFKYTRDSTNEVKKASDWVNPIPPWLKYIEPPK